MPKPDDSVLTSEQLHDVREEARRALQAADGFGCFPTPVDRVMEKAKVVVGPSDALDERLLARLRRKADGFLKRALEKVLGVLDAVARLVYIDRTVLVVKQTFLKLHETAHAFMPWQRDLYRVVEDCEKTISPEMSEQFDREANVFASEVLFQLETFTEEAAGYDFGILVPVKLHSKYGASIYSAVRRYVYTSLRPGGPGRFPAQGSHRSSLKEPVASRACRRFFGRGIFCTPDFSVLLASNRAST